MRSTFTAVIIGLVGLISLGQPPSAGAFSGEIFEITGSGKLFHFEAPPTPGQKAPVTSVKASALAPCITGGDATCTGFLEQDAGGKAYVYFDSDTSWRIATNPDGTDTTTLTGLVAGDGSFMMSGRHEMSETEFTIQGKVKFQKGTFTPLSMNGSISAVSNLTLHYGTGKVKTVGDKVN
ncbi:MAG: hypothetical protein HYV04_09995 [Deltaproteobacteria bacterium]|nr:hypothetical protein [Deltaproteobacteria bacterium]